MGSGRGRREDGEAQNGTGRLIKYVLILKSLDKKSVRNLMNQFIPQKEKNNADNGSSGDAAAQTPGSNTDGGDAQSSGSGEDTALNPAERSLLQKVLGNMIQ